MDTYIFISFNFSHRNVFVRAQLDELRQRGEHTLHPHLKNKKKTKGLEVNSADLNLGFTRIEKKDFEKKRRRQGMNP